MHGSIRYNERSWAIDLISKINEWANSRSVVIKSAGGEWSLSTEENTLFPDLLLFGDRSSGKTLQGWELKFPGTPITDTNLIENAKKKAQNLGLNSFLVWNVSVAMLYRINPDQTCEVIKTWDDLAHIKDRIQVESSRTEWKIMLETILEDLVDFLDRGVIRSTSVIDSISGDVIGELILKNENLVVNELEVKMRRDINLSDTVNLWWLSSKDMYSEFNDGQKLIPLARTILNAWFNKIIFAHILKSSRSEANEIEKIDYNCTLTEITNIFNNISRYCDFWNIFGIRFGEDCIPDIVLNDLISFNKFLVGHRFQNIDQSLLHDILIQLIYKEKRKISGQYTTPKELADLLVNFTVDDKTLNLIDPCCGTGTIAQSAHELKKKSGMDTKDAFSTVWASDKFEYPIQIATLAMVDTENIGEVIQSFIKDATELEPNMEIQLYDPNDGSQITKRLSNIQYIVSNLPFVRQETLEIINPGIRRINDIIKQLTGEETILDARSDLYAYLIFYLWNLLEDNGKMGIIVSNSWLSTNWGNNFKSLLSRFFKIETIVTSGNTRWFKDAQVVTNILVLKKRSQNDVENHIMEHQEQISFVTLNISVDYRNRELLNYVPSLVRADDTTMAEVITKYSYTHNELSDFYDLGLGWNAMFANCKWVVEIEDKLIKANTIFEISRGKRRGWNSMFYPENGHGIEADYIKPILKSSSSIKGLIAEPDKQAFCCTKTLDELSNLGHIGAFRWIKKFESGVNGKGEPLPIVLARSAERGMEWYQMSPSTLADLVTSINPEDRLFIAKLEERSFVDQRLIRFTKIDDSLDIDICHALLNSIVGQFYVEAIGFGRGLGALDLTSEKLKNNLFMLDPHMLTTVQKSEIMLKFHILLQRNIMPISEEIEQTDRLEFEKSVLSAFDILDCKDKILDSLIMLYSIRKSVMFD